MKKSTFAIKVICGISIATSCGVIFGALDTRWDFISEPQAVETVEGIETLTPTIQKPSAYATQAREVYERGNHQKIYKQDIKIKLSAEDRVLMERLIMAEAESESLTGQALVGCVLLNRVNSPDFPDTLEGVVFQEGQFSTISNGRFDAVEPNDDVKIAVNLVQSGWDESQGATYFEAANDSSWHEDNLTYLFNKGGHYFYK